jgi:5-oxoprolinase (ATP-hydrolysing)
VSILSERRAFAPYGLLGGEPGSRGFNLLLSRESNRLVNLGGKNTVSVKAGDRLSIFSPGGGGYGLSTEEETLTKEDKGAMRLTTGSLHQYALNQESV